MNKYNLIVLIAVGFFILGAGFWMTSNSTRTKRLLLEQTHECINGGIDKLDAWGVAGWMRYCKKGGKKNGRWVAWEGGYKHIEGQFKDGKKYGRWLWFDSKGNIIKERYYIQDSLQK